MAFEIDKRTTRAAIAATFLTLTLGVQADAKTYIDEQYGFRFDYPDSLTVETQFDRPRYPFFDPPVAFVMMDDGHQTEGFLTVSISSRRWDLDNCVRPGATYSHESGTSLVSVATEVINGVQFARSDREDKSGPDPSGVPGLTRIEAPGINGFDRDYTVLRGGKCFAIEVAAFPSACIMAVRDHCEWSRATELALLAKLDAIAHSFRFTK